MNDKEREDPFYLAKLALEGLRVMGEIPPVIDIELLQQNAAFVYSGVSTVTQYYGKNYREGSSMHKRLDLMLGDDLMRVKVAKTYTEALRYYGKNFYYILMVKDPTSRANEINKIELSWSGVELEHKNSGLIRIPRAQISSDEDREKWVNEFSEPLVNYKYKDPIEEERDCGTLNLGLKMLARDVSEGLRNR